MTVTIIIIIIIIIVNNNNSINNNGKCLQDAAVTGGTTVEVHEVFRSAHLAEVPPVLRREGLGVFGPFD